MPSTPACRRCWRCEPTGELEYLNGGDEHGILRAGAAATSACRAGRDVWLIPGHCDPTVNLHNHLIGVAGGLEHGKVDKIIRVDARGALT